MSTRVEFKLRIFCKAGNVLNACIWNNVQIIFVGLQNDALGTSLYGSTANANMLRTHFSKSHIMQSNLVSTCSVSVCRSLCASQRSTWEVQRIKTNFVTTLQAIDINLDFLNSNVIFVVLYNSYLLYLTLILLSF
jgi:hypothetical protein